MFRTYTWATQLLRELTFWIPHTKPDAYRTDTLSGQFQSFWFLKAIIKVLSSNHCASEHM